ncbi:methyl-accepting chemotaxis protein [Chroococcidiopsis sp. CCNUC1]|uniref:methyl-accepting chemotaxis protein n=1 Tax=Chroococcidiopsis sp. CCNUC1 TaxID=2653189 RepID=UPI0020212661|nr:methyl-accepting chemotaxis protein [Chroococcidiopsis sp. CCNUC1]URD50615.1 methyl-accepting chemotaxis protein [Chroococcidiopsis sp. CCNUC1]
MNSPSQPNSAKNTHKGNYNEPFHDDTAFEEQPMSEIEGRQNFSQNHSDLEPNKQPRQSHKKGRSLRFKATAVAVALSTIPVMVIGATAYFFTNQQLHKDVTESQVSRNDALSKELSSFMIERYGDIQVLANLPILANPKVVAITTPQEKQNLLDRYINAYKVYNSIAMFDLNGDTVVQSKGKPIANHKDAEYFQQALKTGRPVISQPAIAKTAGTLSFNVAAPVRDSQTNQIIGVVRAKIPAEAVSKLLEKYGTSEQEFFVIDANAKILGSQDAAELGKEAKLVFPKLQQMQAAHVSAATTDIHATHQEEHILTYAPLPKVEEIPDLGWSTAIARESAQAFAAQQGILLTFAVGTAIVAFLVSAIAAYMVNRVTRPILDAADAVEKLGQGELDTRIAVEGEDELAILGTNINQMASQLQQLLQNQTTQTQQANFLSEIASARDGGSEDLETVFSQAVQGARELLQADRVVVYRFNPNGSGYIAAESVLPGLPRALDNNVDDACISEQLLEEYRRGRVVPTSNVMAAGFHPEHLRLMERLQIKANLVTPILKNDQLFGLLIAHHCEQTHTWQQEEINFLKQLASQLGIILNRLSFLEQKQAAVERASMVKDITIKLTQGLGVQEIMATAVQELRQALNSDRVVIYSFNDQWKGRVIAESVGEGFPKALGADIDDPCFAKGYVERYRQGRVQATENIYDAGLTDCHIAQLQQFAVKANLVAPVIRSGELLGLLIAHQCDAPRKWQQEEIVMFSQVATQVGLALDRASLLEQQQNAKEFLQRRALELLMEVDPVSRGDLTIRANVTEDEIGTIADSYNATINSLRKIVTQVQTTAKQVAHTTTSNERSVGELSQEALRQTEAVTAALERIQQMSDSILAVANSAFQAEAAVQQATQTVAEGDTAMNRTVDGMMAIRQTVAETSKKVKRLGESSQKISKVVNLIGTFADQTNLLALNASIEAAHAGEQGRGFAVVADEVRTLARQSAEATAEIESLVKDIQTETNEVVAAMEAGTEQVVTGTVLVHETRQNLLKITEVSQQISELVAAIASAAALQSQTSQVVTATMTDVAAIADRTSNEATVVSAAFKELSTLAQELQTSASQFKVS